MTDPLIAGDAAEPREWDIGNRTLISSVGQRHALGVLNARYPLLLPVRSVLKFDDVLDDQRVAGVGVIADQRSGIVCGEVDPVTGTPQGIAGANPAGPVAGAMHLHALRSVPPQEGAKDTYSSTLSNRLNGS
jgi:hypothetical protein